MKKKRVIVAMSGGVDSSVTAALLQRQGYECIGMHLRMWEDSAEPSEALSKNKCCNLNGVEDARWVCAKLGIPFYNMNVEAEFKERVVDYFLDGYAKGETPNPCIECNRSIKFGLLWQRAKELGADFLASGHYAKIQRNERSGAYELFMASDRQKDQTYFLYTLTQQQLAGALFPLGALHKKQTYELAAEFGLMRVIEKPQSQGLCFFSEGNPKYFLMRYLPKEELKPGSIIDLSGREIGTHMGLSLYTIGQRHGLGIGGIKGESEGEAWYVVSMDRVHNRLTVGRKKDIGKNFFVCSDVSFVSKEFPNGPIEVSVRIRHRGKLAPAALKVEEGRAFVKTCEPLEAPSVGQSAVFYDGEKLLGGGIILGETVGFPHLRSPRCASDSRPLPFGSTRLGTHETQARAAQ